jgi:hypothetical protein
VTVTEHVAIIHSKNSASEHVIEKSGTRHVAKDHGDNIARRTLLGICLVAR